MPCHPKDVSQTCNLSWSEQNGSGQSCVVAHPLVVVVGVVVVVVGLPVIVAAEKLPPKLEPEPAASPLGTLTQQVGHCRVDAALHTSSFLEDARPAPVHRGDLLRPVHYKTPLQVPVRLMIFVQSHSKLRFFQGADTSLFMTDWKQQEASRMRAFKSSVFGIYKEVCALVVW
jgi:hypothetical protein